MTTIAYRDGILAADTMVSGSGCRVGSVVKAFRRTDGHMAGAAGDLSWAQRLLGWFTAGEEGEAPLPKENAGEAIIVRPDGEVFFVDESGMHTLSAEFFSLGSGACVALGAMAAGASAETAIEIACRFDCHTGGDITVLHLKD